ncbi:MAG: tetratricopeptide repeat protein [Planctomycetota bacterium]
MAPTNTANTSSSDDASLPTWAALLILTIAGIIAYANVTQATYVYDDRERVMTETSIRALPDLGEVLGATRRPAVNLSLALNYVISPKDDTTGNPEPIVFQLTNLIIHIATACALFALIRRSLYLVRGSRGTMQTWVALAASLLWVVHPLTTQCVPYIIQRGESMAALCYVLTLLALAKSASTDQRRRWLLLSVALCGAGMLTKATMVTAPIAALLYDRCFMSGTFMRALGLRAVYYVGLAGTWILLAVTGVIQGIFSTDRAENASVGFSYAAREDGLSSFEYFLAQPEVILHYLRLVVLPTALCLDYGWTPASGMRMIMPLIVVSLLGLGALYLLWKKPPLGFVAALFFLILGPTSSFIPIQDLAYDHRMYLPLACVITFGITICWRWLGTRESDAPPPLEFLVPVIIGAIGLATMTLMRNADYRDPLVMWRDVVMKRPDNPRGHLHIGTHLMRENSVALLPDARKAFEKALELRPDYAEAHLNHGAVLGSLADVATIERSNATTDEKREQLDRVAATYYRLSVKAFKRYIELKPNSVFGYTQLGVTYVRLRRFDDAIDTLDQGLAIRPRFGQAKSAMAVALTMRATNSLNAGDPAEAIPDYERAISLNPDLADAHRLLGVARQQVADRDADG